MFETFTMMCADQILSFNLRSMRLLQFNIIRIISTTIKNISAIMQALFSGSSKAPCRCLLQRNRGERKK